MLDAAIAKKEDALLPTNPTIDKYDMFLDGKIESLGFLRQELKAEDIDA